MSWSNHQTPETAPQTVSNQEVLALKQKYDDAELAYQALKYDFTTVSQQLKKTETALNQCQQQSAETDHQFAKLKAENETQKQTIQTLVSQSKQYLTEIEQVKSVSQAEIHAKVQTEVDLYQHKLFSMKAFAEYLPTFIALITLCTILYALLGK